MRRTCLGKAAAARVATIPWNELAPSRAYSPEGLPRIQTRALERVPPIPLHSTTPIGEVSSEEDAEKVGFHIAPKGNCGFRTATLSLGLLGNDSGGRANERCS